MIPVDEAGGYEVAYEQLVPIVDENGQEHAVQYVDQHGHPVVMAPYHTVTEVRLRFRSSFSSFSYGKSCIIHPPSVELASNQLAASSQL